MDIKITEEHKKLLKHMDFQYFENGGDYVFMGCDGKRPFGNSNIYSDIAKILAWELPNEDLSYKQREEAEKLIRELPIVLNEIIKQY